MLRLIERPRGQVLLRVSPAARAIVSWNSAAPSGAVTLTAHRSDGSVSAPLPFVRWSPNGRRSFSASDRSTRVVVDELRSGVPLSAIGVSSSVDLDGVAVSVPSARVPAGPPARARELDVPALSQYLPAHPRQRGWCSAASLGMLLRFHGIADDLISIAAGVHDAAYGGTGNWTFNTAYAGARGLRAAVAYLDGLDHVAAFLNAGLPVAISVGWRRGELPGAPLEHSVGHLLVVRGLDASHAEVNDPAHPAIATRYPRPALDAVFRAHGGIAYLLAPRERTGELVTLANDPDAARAR